MASQRAKVIDVTRSYVPVDPDAYPDNYHATGQEDNPEERVPVVPYNGENFLPTSYGYKSYFGTSATLNMTPLETRIDHILLYQSTTLVNALVVMAEDGIYTKTTADTADWVHAVELTPPEEADSHLEWTYCVINNELYMYRQGGPVVYKVNDIIGDIEIEELTPTFLNMEGQVGIFKAGGRLGFWDSDNSFSWSSIDDYMEFTPSVTTLAGNTKWTDQVGNTVAVHSHGDGFMIYATKSIIWAQKRTDELNLYKANPVFIGCGIAYPRQIAVGTPDTVHFAWTNMGLYKIDNGLGTAIVPEVYDMMKMATQPIYLKLLAGRYLFIESLDPDFISGKAPYRQEVVPETPIKFPGARLTLMEAIDEMLLKGDSFCYDILPNFMRFSDQMDADGSPNAALLAAGLPGDAADKPDYQPVYTCNIRPGLFSDGEVKWKNTPCAVNGFAPTNRPFDLNPDIKDFFATRDTEFWTSTGEETFVDGRWTIERFVALQTAIWKKDQQNLQQLKSKLRNRQDADSKTEPSIFPPTNVTGAVNECTSISLPGQFEDPKFGINECSFWLTRYAIGKEDVVVKKHDTERGEFAPVKQAIPKYWSTIGYLGTSLDAAKAAVASATGRPVVYTSPGIQNGQIVSGHIEYDSGWHGTDSGGAPAYPIYEWAYPPDGYVANDCVGSPYPVSEPGVIPKLNCRPVGGCYINNKKRVGISSLVANADDAIRVYPDTAYCTLTGFSYKKADGSTGLVGVKSCRNASALPSGRGGGGGEDAPKREVPYESTDPTLEPADDSGLMCSTPFEPITIPGEDEVTVDWPDETVTIPETNFNIRDGSYAPLYPIMSGAFMYDLHLKKWGKIRHDYRHLFDYSPINKDNTGIISIDFFGITGGLLGVTNTLHLFDDNPANSWLTWGKIGYYRLGMTSIEELKMHFKTSSTGSIEIEGSLTGHHVSSGLKKTYMFNDTKTVFLGVGVAARWHNITVRGRYDVSYLEYRGFINGRR